MHMTYPRATTFTSPASGSPRAPTHATQPRSSAPRQSPCRVRIRIDKRGARRQLLDPGTALDSSRQVEHRESRISRNITESNYIFEEVALGESFWKYAQSKGLLPEILSSGAFFSPARPGRRAISRRTRPYR